MHVVLKTVLSIVLSYALLLAIKSLRNRGKRGKLPPGPPTLPFLGNLLQLPTDEEWVTYRAWGKKYGDIYTIKVPGDNLMILSSRKVMVELLEQRSAIYSDRPHLVMANEIVGWGDSVVMAHYGDGFRTNRRMMKAGLGPSAVQSYYPSLEKQCVMCLRDLERKPEEFAEHFRNAAGSVALKIAYGEEVCNDESLISLSHEVMKVFGVVAIPGVWLVDVLPVLKHVPSWFPFAEFQRYGKHGRALTQELLHKPYNAVKQRLALGTAGPSFTSTFLQNMKSTDPETESSLQWSATSIVAGNSDTTTAALSYFMLAMLLHPDVQAKAQTEIDKIVGSDRLPQIEDRSSLPYVDAVMKEVLRWHPVVPLLTHACIKDDIYNGYYIPAGSAIMANVWAACHDESEYKDPNSFRPERYFAPENAPDSSSLAFGFGRRICPGIHIAQANVFLTMASILAVFKISNAVDAEGRIIVPEDKAMSGVVSFPKEFKCSIKPRSEAAAQLLHRSLIEMDVE